MKVCNKCKQQKALNTTNFSLRVNSDKFRSVCKPCRSEQGTIWNKAHPERRAISVKKYSQSEKGVEKIKKFRETHQGDFKIWSQENYQRNKKRYDLANKEWVNNNPERKKEIANSYSERNREILREKSKLRYNPENSRENHLKKTYGITGIEYERMCVEQNNSCKICLFQPNSLHTNKSMRRLHVDHCHTTGKVRGLLCFKCNGGLGKFNDDTELLQLALEYLKKND